jgi:citrate/tricarballylate utilization protein
MSAAERPAAGSLPQLVEEAQRVLAICNACRYCEGYCAVFPALQRRLEFTAGDVDYLANLCHNCGSCLYACQYAPPHEFQLNFPRLLAQVRARTWRRYAWPGFLGRAFASNGTATAIATALAFALMLLVAAASGGAGRLFAAIPDAQGSFYALIPHGTMAGLFGAVSLFVLAAFAIGLARFWNDVGEAPPGAEASVPAARAIADALTLKHLDGGGDGCTYPGETPSFARRRFHHLTFYGFALAFAATAVATVYHYVLGWKAPYPFWSLPVVLGTVGGIGLLVGPAGLAWLRSRRDESLTDPAQRSLEAAFGTLLFLTSLTGLALLAFRETRAMGLLLAAHLGTVLALFLAMPYGKFAHAPYRLAALLRYHIERRRPPPRVAPD